MSQVRAIYPRKAQIERTIAAAKAAGIKVGGFEVGPDGTIRILSEAEARTDSSYDRWAARRDRAA